ILPGFIIAHLERSGLFFADMPRMKLQIAQQELLEVFQPAGIHWMMTIPGHEFLSLTSFYQDGDYTPRQLRYARHPVRTRPACSFSKHAGGVRTGLCSTDKFSRQQ